MKRREFVTSVGIGSATVAAVASVPMLATSQDPNPVPSEPPGPPTGSLANVVVSFGDWTSDPPLDRYPNASPGGPNRHDITPVRARVKLNGTVTFAIAGLHQVIVYGPGTRPQDISTAGTVPTTGTPAGVALVNDPRNRVYRGLDPSLHPRDRIEVVHFSRLGVHLVICGVLGHFNMGMYSFVEVVR